MDPKLRAVVVRPAESNDAQAVAWLRWTWRVGERGEVGLTQADFTARFRQWLHEHRETHFPFLAEAGGSPVGMAWLALVVRVPGPGKWLRLAGNLQSVYVLPNHRGRGVGSGLVAAVIQDGKAKGLDHISVHPSQPSVSLYRRLGFTDIGSALELDLRAAR